MDSRTEFDVARHLLDEAHLHPAIRSLVASHHLGTVQAVQAAIAENRVVIVGMAGNPVVAKARSALQAHTIAYKTQATVAFVRFNRAQVPGLSLQQYLNLIRITKIYPSRYDVF